MSNKFEISEKEFQHLQEMYEDRLAIAESYLLESEYSEEDIRNNEDPFFKNKSFVKAASCIVEGIDPNTGEHLGSYEDSVLADKLLSTKDLDPGLDPLKDIFNAFGVSFSNYPLATAIAEKVDKEGY